MFYKSLDLHGKLDRNGCLIKKGKQVVLYQVYDGFAIPVEVLKRIRSVEVHYKGVVYTARVDDFYGHGIEHRFGDEDQLVLPRKYWKVAGQGVLL